MQEHPFAWRMLFADTTGDLAVQELHRQVAEASRAAMLPLLARQLPAGIPGGGGARALEMTWEVVRAGLQGLALWWREHPGVPREQVVTTAMNTLWLGIERLRRGQHWQPGEQGAAQPSRR